MSEQGGRQRVVKGGSLLATPFLTIPSASSAPSGERGLLGVAFDPAFRHATGSYTSTTRRPRPTDAQPDRPGACQRRRRRSPPATRCSSRRHGNPATAGNHNAGAIALWPGRQALRLRGRNANGPNAQTLSNLNGKMLRIEKDGTIPADNPFFSRPGGSQRRSGPSDCAIRSRSPSAGQAPGCSSPMLARILGRRSTWLAGANYGWPTTEGPFNRTTYPQFRSPRYAYDHSTRRRRARSPAARSTRR